MNVCPEVGNMSEPEVESPGLLCWGAPAALLACQGKFKQEWKRGRVLAQRTAVLWEERLGRGSAIHWLSGIIPNLQQTYLLSGLV